MKKTHTLLFQRASGVLFSLSLLLLVVPARAQTTEEPKPADRTTTTTTTTTTSTPSTATTEVVKLAPFQVYEDRGTGYRTVETMSATGFNVEISKLPMSVSVVNRQLIDDIAPSLIVDALVTVPGVTKSGLPIDVPSDQFFIRGFAPPLKQDGVLVNQMEGTFDSFNLAKIEIIRGPSAIFNPSGSAGGSVQLVTKSPTEKNGGVIRAEVGDFYGDRLDFDYNLVIPVPSWNEDRIFFRIVASKQDADTMEENGHIKMESIAPSLRIKLGARADLVLRYQHLGIDDSVAQGQPYYYQNGAVGFIPGVPRERSVFLPDTNTHAVNSTFAADLTFAVTDWLNGAIKYRDMHTETARFHSRPNNEPTTVLPNGDVPSRFFSFNKGLDTKYLSIDFASEFDLGPTHHQALAGVELLHNGPVVWMDEFNFPPGNPLVFNIYRSPENLPIPPKTGSAIPGPFGDSRTTDAKLIENMSIFDRTLSFTAGVVSHYQEDALAPGNAGTNTVVQWGVLYDTPLDRLTNGEYDFSVYYSDNQSILPQFVRLGRRNPDGTVIMDGPIAKDFGPAPAQENNLKEVGGRFSLWKDKLTLTAAYYDIDLTNRLQLLFGTSNFEVVGGGTSKGVEFSADLALGKNVKLLAAYSKGKVRNDAGQRIEDVPEETASLWTRYDFLEGTLKNLGVNVGIDYIGDRTGTTSRAVTSTLVPVADGQAFTYGARTLVNLKLDYRWNHMKFELMVDNVFDKDYMYGRVLPWLIVPGDKRNFRGAVSYLF